MHLNFKFDKIYKNLKAPNVTKNQSNNNIESIPIQNNVIEKKTIPYSYIPDPSEEDKDKSGLKCIRVIKGHYKWCNCLIVLKSKHLCSCSGGIRFAHYFCIKKWMETKLILKENEKKTVKSYNIRAFNCEICKTPYPCKFNIFLINFR